jgi:hypothetical protein
MKRLIEPGMVVHFEVIENRSGYHEKSKLLIEEVYKDYLGFSAKRISDYTSPEKAKISNYSTAFLTSFEVKYLPFTETDLFGDVTFKVNIDEEYQSMIDFNKDLEQLLKE